ncbi:zinc finger protein [Reticulomyxa filosa]|uniref:Zinc finger protein n=1 Tax=Reticulomyxa filosa TaxID=46433 RepID=X6P026_RETFI|nr:zinc finger protein [Reticulomyxa filosa]|eukprot:ETO31493.1 zinc finger protein [Reticulomyxa filosa]
MKLQATSVRKENGITVSPGTPSVLDASVGTFKKDQPKKLVGLVNTGNIQRQSLHQWSENYSLTAQEIDENQQRSRISPKNTKPHLYKTELCFKFQQFGWCPYNQGCQFAHGKHELRKKPSLHNKNTLDNSKQPSTTPQVSAVPSTCAVFPYFVNNNLPAVYNQPTFHPLPQHVTYQSSVMAPKLPFANDHATTFVGVQPSNPLAQNNIINLDEKSSNLIHLNETVGNTSPCAISEFSSLPNTLLNIPSNFSTSPAKSDISLNRLMEGLVIPLKNETNILKQETVPQNPIDKELEKINESIQQLEKKRESLLYQINKTTISGSPLFLSEVTKSNKENFFPIGGY